MKWDRTQTFGQVLLPVNPLAVLPFDKNSAIALSYGMGLRGWQKMMDPDLTTPLTVFLLEDLQ